MKNIKDELYYKDLTYQIKSFAGIPQEYNMDTEKRISERLYARDINPDRKTKFPEWAVVDSYFWNDLVKFCFDVGEIVNDPYCIFRDLRKYPDTVLEELKVLEFVLNEKEFNVEDFKK